MKVEDLEERWEWLKAGNLANQYKRDEKWITRGLQACREVGVSPDYFIRRYLDGDKSVPLREDVDAVFRQLCSTYASKPSESQIEARKGVA